MTTENKTTTDASNAENTAKENSTAAKKFNKEIRDAFKNRITSRSFAESRGTYDAKDWDEKIFPSRKSRVYRNIALLTSNVTGRFDFAPQQNYVLIEKFLNKSLPKEKRFYLHYSTPNFALDVYRDLDAKNVRHARYDAREEINAEDFLKRINA